MDKVQFKDFFFPHNPASIVVERAGRQAVFFCPGYGEVVQPLYSGRRQIRCTGDFVCASAAESAALIAEFERRAVGTTPGVLLLPGMEPMLCLLAQHSFAARGDGRVTPYSIRFIEAGR